MKQGSMKPFLRSPALAFGLAAAVALALPVAAQPPAASGRIAPRDQSSRNLRVAAEAGLRRMTFDLAQGLPANGKLPADFPIAVSSYAELRQVTLGIGFEVDTVDPSSLLYARQTADIGRMARGTGVWKFVMLSKGQPVGLLEMNNVNGKWQAVGAGSARLAQDVNAAASASTDGSFRFVRIYQATSDLMEVRGKDSVPRYVALPSAQRSLSLSNAKMADGTLSSQELLPSLQAAVRANLAHANR